MAIEDPYETVLGRRKLAPGTSTWSVLPTGPLFPIRLEEDYTDLSGRSVLTVNWRIQAELLDSSRAKVVDRNQISLLRNRGCYGYLPSEERLLIQQLGMEQAHVDTDDEEMERRFEPNMVNTVSGNGDSEESDQSKELYLTDEEIMFLVHTLGCLDVILPHTSKDVTSAEVTNSFRLWFYLCCGQLADQPLEPHVARVQSERFRSSELDLLRRYAAYVYYRARGWIVRPGLALGGVHFLLYAQGPSYRHAAFAVLVDPATSPDADSKQITCGEMAAHVRVVHSVGKRLILCRVRLPRLDAYQNNPWDAIREATVSEVLIDHWTPSCKQSGSL